MVFGALGRKEPEPEPVDEATQLKNMDPNEMSGEQLQQRIANGAQEVGVQGDRPESAGGVVDARRATLVLFVQTGPRPTVLV